MDVTIPAPDMGSTDTAAPQVTTQNADEVKTPQAETPAGTEAKAETASEETQSQEGDDEAKKTWKEKRQERNKQRWQEYKQAKDEIPARMRLLEREIASLKGTPPPDFTQISDPTEEIAQRAAYAVRQASVQDKESALHAERQLAAENQHAKMLEAWDEAKQDARTRIPDFDQVVDSAAIHVRAAPHIVESEKAAELAYYLGKNPQAAQSLYQQFETSPARALIELGKIEARLSAQPAKTVSTAPRPASILGGGVNPLAFDPSKGSADDMAEHLRKAGIIR